MAATHRPQNGPVTVHVVEAENQATLISKMPKTCPDLGTEILYTDPPLCDTKTI